MLFDLLAIGLIVGAYRYARRLLQMPLDHSLMPEDDRPPEGIYGPVPGGLQRRRYIDEGLLDLEDFLAEHDQTA